MLLVDDATRPSTTATDPAAIEIDRRIQHAPKLHFLYTHFDQVEGVNLPTFSSREEHVLASVDNVLKAIGDDLGPADERALRHRVDDARFFVGGIQDSLDPSKLQSKKKLARRTVAQLQALLEMLIREPGRGGTRPVAAGV